MSSSESSRRFHFIREIASGGFGTVYLTKVIHADGFSRPVAVKLLHPRWSENEEIASRMRDEARLLGWLRHKNIVDVMDLTLIDGRCAVIMEYLDAVDMKVIISHCAETGKRIPLRPALEICAAVASALDAAYNRPPYAGEKPLRVIHRDIKPSNIMLDDSGVVKVLDFGVARAEFDERESKTQEMTFGSLEYMPPERLFFEPESPASDIYSLGATLFEMLALEKFGKAKLRPKEHEAYFEDRFDVLLDKYPMHREAEDLLHELLMSMLAFDEPDRPSAAEAVSRMRFFGRRIAEHPLEEWAETFVPPLLKLTRERSASRSPGSLVDKILTEDAKALDQKSIWDENTGASTRAIDLGLLDDELTSTVADDANWKALQQAAIDQISPSRSASPASRAKTPAPELPPQPLEPLPITERPGSAFDSATAPTEPAHPAAVFEQPEEQPPKRSFTPPPPPISPAARAAPPAPPHSDKRLLVVAVMLLLGSGIGLLGISGVGFVLALGMLTTSPDPAPLPAPPPAPAAPSGTPAAPAPPPPPADATPTPDDAPRVRFVSARADTTKMQVVCDGGRGKGSDEVTIRSDKPGTCMVVAILGTGQRLRARVKDAKPRDYTCFVGDSTLCR